MNQHSINEVRATLKYGRAINKRQFVGAIIGSIAIIPCIPGFLVMAIMERIYIGIFMVLVFAFGEVMLIRVLCKWHKERPYIKQCLEDAVEVVADCKEDKSNPKCGKYYKGTTIVEFTYNDQKIVLKSCEKCYSVDDFFHIHGNDIYFKLYFDKHLKVLYSPRYNEILFTEPFTYNENNDYEIA